ncbi:unnamed protein product [Dovyalis caffra]|uniref:RING-type E3 ubiquitin transferase n=1 Tax=Dovyalis caffra TaxID=77055 RepID=A0AAV1RE23_9ROSI|nr:unnamed protein product [Dovyalis caffra]
MKPHNRKLQVPYNDAPFEIPTTTTLQSSNTATLSPPPVKEPTTIPPPTTSLQQQFYIHTGFDSSMALTILVLLIALFFMGFFSIYIRKFSNADPESSEGFSNSSSRQRSRGPLQSANTYNRPSRTSAGSRTRGLDPQVVKSLPVYSYYHGDVKYQIECAICLGEFEEKESVKMIPTCQHVFHLECIDMWLQMHVTCPVCRGTQFFYDKGGGSSGVVVVRGRVDQGASQPEARSVVEREVETLGVQLGKSILVLCRVDLPSTPVMFYA